MTAVRCPSCGAGAIVREWTEDCLEVVVHRPACKYVAPVQPFPAEVPA